MIYFIADTHFNHARIMEYCNRPFRDVGEMNAFIASRWTEKVGVMDTVYHLGDVGFGNIGFLVRWLPGDKHFIRGNHDRFGKKALEEMGFVEMSNKPITISVDVGNAQLHLLLSHWPIKEIPDTIDYNIHGHIHDKPFTDATEKHICVSVEVINYTPVSLNELLAMKKVDKEHHHMVGLQ